MHPVSKVLAFALVLAAWSCSDNQAQDLFERGGEYFAQGEYEKAVETYEAGLALEPESAVGWNLLGMACRMQFNELRSPEWKEKEEQAFRRAVSADSTFWPAQINLGATLYYAGKPKEAAPHFRKALDLNPQNPERERLLRFMAEGEQ